MFYFRDLGMESFYLLGLLEKIISFVGFWLGLVIILGFGVVWDGGEGGVVFILFCVCRVLEICLF